MNNDNLSALKNQYVAAMSVEMQSPLKKIIDLASGSDERSPENKNEIQDAAKYLLSLVDELADFARFKP